jgi:tetratricopeptide (TPR) repeat protein
MTIKEYGRNVHNMVSYLMKIEDKETRQKNAEAIIEVMAVLSPQLKDIEDYRHKLWDHLYLMTDYKLEVDCPYPVPTQEAKEKKPDPLHYPKTKIKWNHFGKKFEDLYNKAIEDFLKVEQNKPNIFPVNVWIAIAYFKARYVIIALEYLEKELIINPQP